MNGFFRYFCNEKKPKSMEDTNRFHELSEELYDAVKDYIQDYVITKDGKDYNVGVKKVYGGDHFFFNKGVCERYVTLRVPSLEKATDELTESVLKEQDETYTKLFVSKKACTGETDC